MLRALVLMAALWPTIAAATVCSAQRTGEVFCGDLVHESLDSSVVGAAWVADDPTSYNAYTCATIVAGGVYTQAGPEHYWSFVCPASGPVTVELLGLSCDMDLVILEPCAATSCTYGSGRSGRSAETISFSCVAGREYWIVPESYQLGLNPLGCPSENADGTWHAHAAYDLAVTCQEICGNGRDDDGDGRSDCEEAACVNTPACCDQDGDGVQDPSCGGDDCDDADAGRAPTTPEIAGDGVDQDCDDVDLCFVDQDQDAFGGAALIPGASLVCDETPGLTSLGGDCRDTLASVYPGAPEVPADGVDQDCDGADLCWQDLDGDAFGGEATAPGADLSCADEPGLAAISGDCRDAGPGAGAIHPGASEVPADGVDQDCDGAELCWADRDDDGFGGSATTASADLRCDAAGLAWSSDDCRDVGPGAESVFPGAVDLPGDGVDQDCDGGDACWQDLDADGFGGAAVVAGPDLSCGGEPGLSATPGDCRDVGPGANAVFPGAAEVPADGVDQDCDGADLCWVDADGDGVGGGFTQDGPAGCTAAGWSPITGDCRDVGPDAATIGPGATELAADGVDQDCDGVDLCPLDRDGDGYGGEAVAPGDDLLCGNAGAEATDSDDCVDAGPGAGAIHPGAVETCNGLDDDCDHAIDDADPDVAPDASAWLDADGDGWGAGPALAFCTPPAGSTDRAGDCDDGAFPISPDGVEICNGVDDDCDGAVDEDAEAAGAWFVDADGDGWGDASRPVPPLLCTPGPDIATRAGDCDDADPGSAPGQAEIPYDTVDQDCDGADLVDRDGDGAAGGPGGADCDDSHASVHPGATEEPDGVDQDCDAVVDDGTVAADDDHDGFSERGGDCDDAAPGVRPGAAELADGADQDCDGAVDEGTDASDDDGDGAAEQDGDCNDADASVHPGAVDPQGDGVDRDCDGVVDGADADADGVAGWAGDCDDANDAVRPGATELANGRDDDCDGVIDDGLPNADDDGDGWTDDQGDCHDGNAAIHPGAAELLPGVDDDCDGAVDAPGPRVDGDGDGVSAADGDCDDANAALHPGGTEVAGGGDEDCDGLVDEDLEDVDGDGFTVADGDCDDLQGWANPEAAEVPDAIDNDCDGLADEDPWVTEEDPPADEGGCACDERGGAGPWWLALVAGLWRRRVPYFAGPTTS